MFLKSVSIMLCVSVFIACSTSETDNKSSLEVSETIKDTSSIFIDSIDENIIDEHPELEWKNLNAQYDHFLKIPLDTVFIGKNRNITDPFQYFSETHENVYVVIEEGEYIGNQALWIDGDNVIIEGRGDVSLLIDVLYDNVMWIISKNVVINNLHMQHLQPGTGESQNCSGRVIGFDGADNVTILNCDLNGCGLAGLHDNLGNGTVYVEYNYIHNNSLGAYTDINGNVWQKEIDDHPVFVFKNNKIEDNGTPDYEE